MFSLFNEAVLSLSLLTAPSALLGSIKCHHCLSRGAGTSMSSFFEPSPPHACLREGEFQSRRGQGREARAARQQCECLFFCLVPGLIEYPADSSTWNIQEAYTDSESMRGALARVCLMALVYSFGSADGLCSAQYGQHLLGHFRPASMTVPIDLRLRGGAAADDTTHGTKCTFRVRVDRIKPGESVVLIGSWCKWQIANAVELTASAEHHQWWYADEFVPVGEQIEFKFAIRNAAGQMTWELPSSTNRRAIISRSSDKAVILSSVFDVAVGKDETNSSDDCSPVLVQTSEMEEWERRRGGIQCSGSDSCNASSPSRGQLSTRAENAAMPCVPRAGGRVEGVDTHGSTADKTLSSISRGVGVMQGACVAFGAEVAGVLSAFEAACDSATSHARAACAGVRTSWRAVNAASQAAPPLALHLVLAASVASICAFTGGAISPTLLVQHLSQPNQSSVRGSFPPLTSLLRPLLLLSPLFFLLACQAGTICWSAVQGGGGGGEAVTASDVRSLGPIILLGLLLCDAIPFYSSCGLSMRAALFLSPTVFLMRAETAASMRHLAPVAASGLLLAYLSAHL